MTLFYPSGIRIRNKKEYKKGVSKLHTKAVSEAKNMYKPNKVLQRNPPPINNEELKLKRATRTSLAQLRSGCTKMVNDYNCRLNPELPNSCPKCNESPHDVNHLFNCKRNPTNLDPPDLWKKPIAVAKFLKIDGT